MKEFSSKGKAALYVYYSGHGLLVDGMTVACTVSGERFPIESKIRNLSTRPNCLVLSFFDCCLEIPPISEKGPKTVEEKTYGQLHIIHAVAPGKSAITRSDSNGLSEVTKEFLSFMEKTSMTFPANISAWTKHHKTVEAVDKMMWQFPLLPGTKAPQVANALPSDPFSKWEPHVVVEWLSTLNLRENYLETVINNGQC